MSCASSQVPVLYWMAWDAMLRAAVLPLVTRQYTGKRAPPVLHLLFPCLLGWATTTSVVVLQDLSCRWLLPVGSQPSLLAAATGPMQTQ